MPNLTDFDNFRLLQNECAFQTVLSFRYQQNLILESFEKSNAYVKFILTGILCDTPISNEINGKMFHCILQLL